MSIHVLLVEDDRVTLEAIRRTLHKYGYEYKSATQLKEAKNLIRKEPFDLILSDLRLPDGSGLELLDLVRQFVFDTPFVVITASEKKSLIQEALSRGADDFLSKPFNLQNLPTVIERNLQRKRLATRQHSAQKVSVLLKAIKALIAALEAKDSYTSGHSLRVARHASIMGKHLGFSEDQQFVLELSALLHDIGKIGMPDQILKKAASLHEMEYNTAKEHVIIGSRIVGEIDELKEVAAIIRHHHERFDGTGYPDGLKGIVIPLYARILAIVDAYESIVSGRTYRKSRSRDEALEELRRNAGTQFDPELVEVFVRAMKTQNGEENVLQFEKLTRSN